MIPRVLFTAVLSLAIGETAATGEQGTDPQAAPADVAAAVQDELRSDPAYTAYAEMLIRIDLLANPVTADLAVQVDVPEPGMLRVTGAVPTYQVKAYVIANARRISGLGIRDEIRLSRTPRKPDAPVEPDQLQNDAVETIAALFPELAKRVDVAIGDLGVVVLTGQVDSIQSKLLLSQAVKSQQGCVAVANLLSVNPLDGGGRIQVTEDGRFSLATDRLPEIPAAQPFELAHKTESGVVGQLDQTIRPQVGADDDMEADLSDQQLRDDVRANLAAAPELLDASFEIEVHSGVVQLSSDSANRAQVEKAIDSVSLTNGVTKIVARCKPISMQRNIPGAWGAKSKREADRTDNESRTTLFGNLFSRRTNARGENSAESGGSLANSRRFRDTVHRTLKRRCGDRIHGLKVRSTLHGLAIEAEVKNLRDRTFVLKQIDNIVELQNIAYDAILTINEP
jgi:osmotically-inducible protein OsmY